jgi:hypothetical protein
MKHKIKMNEKPQAEINTVLAAGALETQTEHGHKGFGSVSDLSGPCVGATIEALIGCEESQEVTKAFRNVGINTYSCDLKNCSGGLPECHFEENIFHVLTRFGVTLKFFGGHPPCTYLANSGVRWLYNSDGTKNEERWEKMRMAAIFFKSLLAWLETIGCGYIENPIMHKYAIEIIGRKHDQIIHPWQHGHGEQKSTCLWLVGLPKLEPSNIVDGREQRIWKLPPSENRTELRSKTYPGIAKAMAEQWKTYVS